MVIQRLKDSRKAAELSQSALAEILGVSQNLVSQWEKGTRNPNINTLGKLADCFSVSTDWLLGRTNQKNSALPLGIGDKVYSLYFDFREWEVTQIDIYKDTVVFRLGNEGTENYSAFHLKELGERYFLTREAAKEAAAKQEGA